MTFHVPSRGVFLAVLAAFPVSLAAQAVDSEAPGVQRRSSEQGPIFGRGPQAIVLAGTVRLDDGTVPSEPVRIERYCGGATVIEDYTDRKGRFSFQLGGKLFSTFLDTSLQAVPVPGNPNMRTVSAQGTEAWFFDGSGSAPVNLTGCVLKAALFGYRSETIPLHSREVLDRPDVGVITLHKIEGVPLDGLEGVRGRSISPTSLEAPKRARELYDKGLKATAGDLSRRDLDKAVKAFNKAVRVFPRFATAWKALGEALYEAENVDAAREAFAASIAADPDYMPPYEALIRLEMRQQQWRRVAEISAKLLELHDGLDLVRYYQAKASFMLDDPDKAETIAMELLFAASDFDLAPVHQLLGVVHASRGRFAMAAREYRLFLATRPDSNVAPLMKKQLAEWEAKGVLTR
jgi:Flp pilus assembly protein TadD